MSDRTLPCPVKVCTYAEWIPPGQEDASRDALREHTLHRHNEDAVRLVADVTAEER